MRSSRDLRATYNAEKVSLGEKLLAQIHSQRVEQWQSVPNVEIKKFCARLTWKDKHVRDLIDEDIMRNRNIQRKCEENSAVRQSFVS